MEGKIKPCPFCGKDTICFSANGKYVYCADCGCRTSERFPDQKKDIVDLWNTRATVEGFDINLLTIWIKQQQGKSLRIAAIAYQDILDKIYEIQSAPAPLAMKEAADGTR